jgi:membrane-associated phospholipid phosphatase
MSIVLPSYGFMDDGLESVASDREPPPAWLSSHTNWESWLNDTLKILRSIWPIDATEQVNITHADLNLMRNVQAAFQWEKRTEYFYALEDAGRWYLDTDKSVRYSATGSTYALQYPASEFATLAEDELRRVREIFVDGYKRSSKSVFAIKRELQRPRPFQTQHMLNAGTPLTRLMQTKLGHSPSFISGHAAQALLSAIHALIEEPEIFASESDQLLLWANDFGMRRIWAGVHYPLDNLGSWIYVARLLPWIYEPTAAKTALGYLRNALDRSELLSMLKGDSELKRFVTILDNALS